MAKQPAVYFNNEPINLDRQKFRSSLKFYVRSSLKEMRRRKLYYCLALFSVLIAVTATALSQTVIDYAPLILLKSAESSQGAKDVEILPVAVTFEEYDGVVRKNISEALLLNMTEIESLTQPEYPDLGTARYSVAGTLINPSQTQGCSVTNNPPYNSCLKYAVNFVFQNTQREADIGLGAGLDLPSEIPSGQIIISDKLARSMNVNVGDEVIGIFDISRLLKALVIPYNFQQPDTNKRIQKDEISRSLTIYVKFKIFSTVETLVGKFPDGVVASTVIYEYKYMFQHIANYIPTTFIQAEGTVDFINFVKVQVPQEFADEIIYNLPDRQEVYTTSNFDDIQAAITKYASTIATLLGVFPFDMALPIYGELYGTKYVGLYLGLILNIIIIVLFVLSVILIYNLLMVTVETRTFEMGVIRMLGLDKRGIVELIFVQALTFVIPGIILGLIISVPLLILLGSILGNKLHTELPKLPSGSALGYALGIGFLIPLVSSYYPMKEALLKNLNLAIDTLHSKTVGTKVTIEFDNKKIPWTKITFGVLTVVFGIAVYILIPESLISGNMGLLLGVFFGILLGILVGLVLLSINFQHLMEKLVTIVFFFWTKKAFRTVVLKNLVAHKLRNRKTAIMYALSLGFVIFVSVALTTETQNMAYQRQQREGALLTVDLNGGIMNKYMLENYIYENLNGVVESFTWITKDLESFLGSIGYAGVWVTHPGGLYTKSARIVGVMPNIFDTTLNQYLDIDEEHSDTGLTLGEQLYTPRGLQSAIIGTSYADYFHLSVDSDETLVVKIDTGNGIISEELKTLAVLRSAPGFSFSSLPSVNNQHIIVSMPTYLRLANGRIRSIQDIPVYKLLIKVYDDSDENLDRAYAALADLQTRYYPALDIYDFRDYQKSLSDNEAALTIIFISIEIIVFILCLFSLITSMSTNILEQTKEIAVLRAMGLTRSKIIRIYMTEAFVLVLSSALFGVFIGIAVSWVMAIQRVLFTQIPIRISFPWKELLIVFAGAIISAIVSTYMPAKRIVKNQIAQIIRMG